MIYETAYPQTEKAPTYLGYASNPIYPSFPPLMNDGRAFGSYQAEPILDKKLHQENGITSNFKYRQFLIDNSEKIKEQSFKEACNDTGFIYRDYTPLGSAGTATETHRTPYLYKSILDNTRSPYEYEKSDLKEIYLSREQLNARKVAPTYEI